MHLIYSIEEFSKDSPTLFAAISTIIGFLIGGIFSYAYEEYLKQSDRNYKLSNLSDTLDNVYKEALQQENLEVFPLIAGKPYWNSGDINIIRSGKRIIVEIPKDKKDEIVKMLGDKFDYGNSTGLEYDSNMFKEMQIPDLQERIERHSHIIAERLIDYIKESRLVFNGEMYGVWNVAGNESKLEIETYDTDFFTYKVFGSIYQELKKEGHPISQVIELKEILRYKPFLSSFGLGTFVLLYNNSHVVVAKRSPYLNHDLHAWHYSMNEAFSQSDFDSFVSKPKLEFCQERGLIEELNVDIKKFPTSKYYFLDLYFTRDHFEMGITSIVEIPELSFNNLQFLHGCAKDAEVEVDELKLLPINKNSINNFLAKEKMTYYSKLNLKLLITRIIDGKMLKINL